MFLTKKKVTFANKSLCFKYFFVILQLNNRNCNDAKRR